MLCHSYSFPLLLRSSPHLAPALYGPTRLLFCGCLPPYWEAAGTWLGLLNENVRSHWLLWPFLPWPIIHTSHTFSKSLTSISSPSGFQLHPIYLLDFCDHMGAYFGTFDPLEVCHHLQFIKYSSLYFPIFFVFSPQPNCIACHQQ